MPRLISPASAFTASLRAAQKTESQGRSTITKGEAEKALKNLDGAPLAERASIVQGFLDGNGAGALSPKARQVLVDFVNNTGAGGGDTALHVKSAARDEAAQAERNVQKAQDRLEKLIKSGAPGEIKGGLQQVRAWLDAAEADVLQAKGQLKKLADSAAKTATHDLDGAQKDLAKAAEDIQKIIDHAKAGNVKKADLAEVRAWLAEPLPELHDAVGALGHSDPLAGGGGPSRHTLKYPSDNEDHGAGSTGNGMATTMRYPSDNEDSGVPVGAKERKVSAQHVTAMRKAVDKAGALQWHKGSVIESHLGERFARVDLGKGLTGFIPLGALTPTATEKDPNKVREFYLERTSGKRTESAGPIKLP